jgi:hypothetical protein
MWIATITYNEGDCYSFICKNWQELLEYNAKDLENEFNLPNTEIEEDEWYYVGEDNFKLYLQAASAYSISQASEYFVEKILQNKYTAKVEKIVSTTPEEHIESVHKFTLISKEDLLSNSKKRELVNGRFLLYKVLYEYYTKNVLEISRIMGKAQHGSILNGLKQMEDIPELKNLYNQYIRWKY